MNLLSAPKFELPDQAGQKRSLHDYHGQWLVIYFYPQDGALNCTREACDFRDEYRALQQFGNATVIAINHGSVESHRKFADKYQLNFPILSDLSHKVTEAYGAWRQGPSRHVDRFYGTRRNTYIINPEGKIAKQYLAPKVKGHVEQVISDLQTLQEKAKATG